MNTLVVSHTNVGLDARILGGKGANLVKLARLAKKHDFFVPDFFIVPVTYNGEDTEILARALKIRGKGNYAVRSSYPEEDSASHSFAGVFKTMLDVPHSSLLDAIREVRASTNSEKAQAYCAERGLTLEGKMAVIIQRMVKSEIGGVIYSTLPSYPIACSIEFCTGLGTGVVDSKSNKIEIHDYRKRTLKEIFASEERIYESEAKNINHFRHSTKNDMHDLNFAINVAQRLEREFGFPLDLEFAWTYNFGRGNMYLLQARPVTDMVQFQRVEFPKVPREGVVLRAEVVRGVDIYEGPAVVYPVNINTWQAGEIAELRLPKLDSQFPDGYVLIIPRFYGQFADCDKLTPNKKVLVEYAHASRSSHAQTSARERGILYLGRGYYPSDSSFRRFEENLRKKIQNGDLVRVVVDGRKGIVYKL